MNFGILSDSYISLDLGLIERKINDTNSKNYDSLET